MSPERRVIYKVFCLLETHLNQGQSLFSIEYVKSVEDRVGVDFKPVRFEKSMNEVTTSSDCILMSLNELYTKAIAKNKAVSVQEEVGDVYGETPNEVDDRPTDQSNMGKGNIEETFMPLAWSGSTKDCSGVACT